MSEFSPNKLDKLPDERRGDMVGAESQDKLPRNGWAWKAESHQAAAFQLVSHGGAEEERVTHIVLHQLLHGLRMTLSLLKGLPKEEILVILE